MLLTFTPEKPNFTNEAQLPSSDATCVRMVSHGGTAAHGKWEPLNCAARQPFICQLGLCRIQERTIATKRCSFQIHVLTMHCTFSNYRFECITNRIYSVFGETGSNLCRNTNQNFTSKVVDNMCVVFHSEVRTW